MDIPAVVITGGRRCGTYLLYRLLDGHPALFNSFSEVYLLEYVHRLRAVPRQCFINYYFRAATAEVFDTVYERELLPLFRGEIRSEVGAAVAEHFCVELDEDALRHEVEARRCRVPRDVAGIWDSWFGALQAVICPAQGLRPALIKSPDYGASAHGAASFLPTFKIIFIVRHPFFALTSLRKYRSNQPHRWDLTTTRILEEIGNYAGLHRTIRQLQAQVPQQVAVVRYEDLVLETEQTLRGIARFLQIPFVDVLLSPTFNGQEWYGDSSFERHSGVSRSPLDPGRLLLTEAEMDMVEACLPEFMSQYGYARDTLSPAQQAASAPSITSRHRGTECAGLPPR